MKTLNATGLKDSSAKCRYWLVVLMVVLVSGCGGGGGGGSTLAAADDSIGAVDSGGSSSRNIGSIFVEEPKKAGGGVRTFAPSIGFKGAAFVSPADVDCVTVFPRQLSMTWRNETTGRSGTGFVGTGCVNTLLFGLVWNTRWSVPEGVVDLAMGRNQITLMVTDGVGNSGRVTIPVERLEDTTAPVIVIRSPGPDALDVPVNRRLSVTFNEPMLESSLTSEHFSLRDTIGREVPGTHNYDESNSVWQFSPNLPLTYSSAYVVTISGDVADLFGANTLGVNQQWSFTTAPDPDVTPPEVTRVSPAPDSACIAADSALLAGFSEPLNSATVNPFTFTLNDGQSEPVISTVSYDGSFAALRPNLPLLPGVEYQATLSREISDLAGNNFPTDFVWQFRSADTDALGTWEPLASVNAPPERSGHSSVWTGVEMIVFGGRTFASGQFVDTDSGGLYDPLTDTWRSTSTAGVSAFIHHSAVWSGAEMLVWGGNRSDGARYDPQTDSWQLIDGAMAPSPRREHAAVWTGNRMIVWGGSNEFDYLGDGGLYDPITDTWVPMSLDGAPSGRTGMAAVWTGEEFVIWGGRSKNGEILTDGARYHPDTGRWIPLPATDAPGSSRMVGAWTGSEVIIWNGGIGANEDSNGFLMKSASLRFYHPMTDTWRQSRSPCEPYLGSGETYAHWTGTELFVWADNVRGGYLYQPDVDHWRSITTSQAPPVRRNATSQWAGDRFILWGGSEVFGGLRSTGFTFRR